METNNNVQIIQKCFSCFQQGDIASILDLLDPNVDWGEPDNNDIPYHGKRHGKAAVQQFFAEVAQIQVAEFTPQDYLAVGNRVVSLGTWSGTVKSTGKKFKSDWAMVWTVENGKIKQFTAYEDTAAVAAAFQA
ncbi:MAG: ketosteroid isomerase [Chthonomonadaceae bacterium]|nr:ketosteroid isomerase [Chthonomonadaceae bacterium]